MIDKLIECYIYIRDCDRLFIEKIVVVGCNLLIILVEYFLGVFFVYIINYCREFGMKVGLIIGCYILLCFVDEVIYDIDRL